MISATTRSADDDGPFALSLREIASWDPSARVAAEPKIRASVPALQRGLVWQPQQIEMLWDSILRGFPIGALVVCRKIETQERKKIEGVTHHLLDGQQRCNAITLGFTDPFPQTALESTPDRRTPILWLDLQARLDASSTRNYLTRLTTVAHPWGYTASDRVERLPAHRIRESLQLIGLSPQSIGYERPLPAHLWPQAAATPVPLAWLLLAPWNDPTAFWQSIRDRVVSVPLPWREQALRFLDDASASTASQKDDVLRGIMRANSAKLIALNAPQELLEISQQEKFVSESQNAISNIEHLFQRLNQQGTRLDGEELAYSMIKAYWPELADPIDKIAALRMPASRMVAIGVRAALAEENADRLPAPVTVSALRQIAQGHDPRKELIYNFIAARLAPACEQADQWLRYDAERNPNGLLPVHVTSIALNSPDVYLLLLCFATRVLEAHGERDDAPKWRERMQALATLLHWFAKEKGKAANRVYAACQSDCSITSIRLALKDAVDADEFGPVHRPSEVDTFVGVPQKELIEWFWWELIQGDRDAAGISFRQKNWEAFLRFRFNQELLLYVQRGFLARRFPHYDPARKDLWDAHNRPWDFDHILASKFIVNRKDQGKFRVACGEWSDTIGNFRAWPFEDNRSDRAETAETKIRGIQEQLADSFLLPEEEHGFSGGDKVRHDEASARRFIETCRQRLLRIYRLWYESMAVDDLLDGGKWKTDAPPSTPTEQVVTTQGALTSA